MRAPALAFLMTAACTRATASSVTLDVQPTTQQGDGAVAPVTTSTPMVAASSAFFPPHTFAAAVDTFTSDWYSKHLRAMGEPSLWAAATHGETVYRFLWLRTWGRPVAVRVTLDGSRAHLFVTRLSGDGGYAPGDVELHRDRSISPAELQRIETGLAKASYDTTETEGATGLDGAQWIIERAKGGKYRLVERWTPKPTGTDGAFRGACEVFLDLAGRDIVTGDVY